MSYLDELKKGREIASVAYQEFVLHNKQDYSGLFCFFEGVRGSDNSYYIPRIKQFTKQYHPIRCGGRKNVLKVHDLIRRHIEYDKYKKAFFIDRDFNAPLALHNPPIFETPCYSIENFYVSIEVFSEIAKNALLLSETDSAYQICINLYTERQKEFHKATILFNAWYACLIELRNEKGIYTGVNLGDKLPKGFINFSLDSISANYDLPIIKSIFTTATDITDEYLSRKVHEFNSSEQHKIFRGKYEMYFLLSIIELILQDSSNTKRYLSKEIKFPFSERLSIEQAIAIFSSYAETPESLIVYLEQVTENRSADH